MKKINKRKMGFLKKIIKKVTKTVDKFIPEDAKKGIDKLLPENTKKTIATLGPAANLVNPIAGAVGTIGSGLIQRGLEKQAEKTAEAQRLGEIKRIENENIQENLKRKNNKLKQVGLFSNTKQIKNTNFAPFKTLLGE